mmetsp:Transcript_11014/g.23363  ORF Transcript_11014/g.23363 Transcript_11014/m.23363 type:complete len:92 (+) Transcript_11014:575-850(+)
MTIASVSWRIFTDGPLYEIDSMTSHAFFGIFDGNKFGVIGSGCKPNWYTSTRVGTDCLRDALRVLRTSTGSPRLRTEVSTSISNGIKVASR